MEEEQKQEEGKTDLDNLFGELDSNMYSDINLLDKELKELEEELGE